MRWLGDTLPTWTAQYGNARPVQMAALGIRGILWPVHWAAAWGQMWLVGLLLRCGAQAGSKGPWGTTPLIWACAKGHVAVGQVLLQHLGGQGLEEHAEFGVTALHCAAVYGREEMVAMLLKEGAQASSRINNGWTPLMLACMNGHVSVVQKLVQHVGGQGLNQKDARGWTALPHAAFQGHTEVVAFLLDCYKRTESELMAAHAMAALINACKRDHMGVVRLLLQRLEWETRLEQRVYKAGTVLHMACSEGFTVEMVKALLLAGADITTTMNNDGATPRVLAEAQGHTQLVALLDWWETELERPCLLHQAKCLHEQCFKHHAVAAASTVPAYLKARVAAGLALPRVEVVPRQQEQQGSVGDTVISSAADADIKAQGEQQRHAVLAYVLEELNEQLFIELMEGFHMERRGQGGAVL